MKRSQHLISYMAVMLACCVGTMQASAQQSNARVFIASNLENATLPLVEGLDGNPAHMNLLSGYTYLATSYGILDPQKPLSEVTLVIDRWNELHTVQTDQIIGGGSSYRAYGGLDKGIVVGDAMAPNVAVVTYHGSIISVSLTPRTRVTFTSELEYGLSVESPENYQNQDAPDMPGVRASTYAYLGPVATNALPTHGFSRGLFDADAEGNICPGCESDGIYWQDQFLEPDPTQVGYPNGVNVIRESVGTTTQQYTITNDGYNEQIFHVLRFTGATGMNVLQTSPVPEVDAMALFGIGLLCIAGLARRQRR